MDTERWRRVEQLCYAALDREQDQQAAFLESACAGDFALRHEVESLLAHRTQAERFIEAPAFEMAAEALAQDESRRPPEVSRWIGRVLSDYRIVDKVGSGGMGEIYRAIRADGSYEKQVAIKLVQSGLGTDYFLERFRNERQILASLDHPNIAKLIDGGSTEEGLPYVVMEYIEGQCIDEYCEQHRLDIPGCLKIFCTVCSAVQYAHKNLVVHRDLKPGNILVTQDGVAKLLDFGIAKILHPEQERQEARTVTMLPLLTPDYASPEQIRNEAITTSSDVYSLGVILYVLLTRHHPYKNERNGPSDLIRAICETEPKKPSAVVAQPQPSHPKNAHPSSPAPATARRDDESKKLRRALAGDLDNIVLRALRKEPEHRYASVEQFSEDIQRHLAHLPVIAHKDTLRYRSQKFVSRNKLGVGAVAIIILSLLAGLVTTLREARIARFERARAERRFNDVRAIANSLIFGVHDTIQDLPGATPARKFLVTNALRYLDSLAQEASGDPSLQAELASAYEKVGDVQGNPNGANLGDTAGALASYHKAVAIRESIRANDGNSDGSQLALAADYKKVGVSLVASGDYKRAIEYARKAFSIQERIAKTSPGPESAEGLAGAHYLLGMCQADLGDFASALDNLKRSAAIRESITDAGPALQVRIQIKLGGTYELMAMVVWPTGERDRTISLLQKDVSILRKLADSDTTNALYREYLDEAYFQLGYYSELKGDLPEAMKDYRRALADVKSLAAADPTEARAKRLIGRCQTFIGTVLVKNGQIASAFKNIRDGLAIAEEVFREDPAEKADKLTSLSDAYEALGFAFSREASQPQLSRSSRLTNWKQARAAYQKSLDSLLEAKRLRALSGLDSAEPGRIARELANCDAALGSLGVSIH